MSTRRQLLPLWGTLLLSLVLGLSALLGACTATGSQTALQPTSSYSDSSDAHSLAPSLPLLPELDGALPAAPRPMRPVSLVSEQAVELAVDDSIFAQTSSVDFDSELGLMTYSPPAGGLAWIIYERKGVGEDFAPQDFWVINNGKDHWTAVANYSKGYWELYPGKHTYYSGATFKGNKTALKHEWDSYASPGGSMYIAVLAQDDALTSSAVGCDIEFETLRTPTGLHITNILGGQANLEWNAYSDDRDLRLVIRYTLSSGQIREKVLAEDTTSALIPNFSNSEYCILARWPEKGVDSKPSGWITP